MTKEDLYINDGAIKKKPQDPKSRKIKNILFILCLILVISGFIVGLHALQVQTSNTITLENSNFQLPEGTTVDDSNNKNNNIGKTKAYAIWIIGACFFTISYNIAHPGTKKQKIAFWVNIKLIK